MENNNFFFDPNEIAGKLIIQRRNFLADPCKICGMYKKCASPKMEPFGNNNRGIFIVGEAPGKDEDAEGIQFVGSSGDLLYEIFDDLDIDMDDDCIRSNVLQCRPVANKFDIDKVQYCYDRLDEQIREANPSVIFCFGEHAASRILETSVLNFKSGLGTYTGDVYPSRKYNAWVVVCWHPAYILRTPELMDDLYRQIEVGLEYVDQPIPEALIDKGINLFLYKQEEIEELLFEMMESTTPVVLDYETNCLSSFEKDSKILYVSLSNDPMLGYVIKLDEAHESTITRFKQFLQSKAPKVIQNAKFEQMWTRVKYGIEVNNICWDTMNVQHLIDERGKGKAGKKSLEYMTYYYFGEEYKHLVDRKNIENSGMDNLIKYSSLDARVPVEIMQIQQSLLPENLIEKGGLDLWIQGGTALHELEYNGVLIDKDFYERYSVEINQQRKEIKAALQEHTLISEYNIDFTKPNSLKKLFFDILNLDPVSHTDKNNPQMNEEFFKSLSTSLADEDADITELGELLLQYKGLEKLSGTYIKSIINYCDVDWFLHPTYNLHIARTYRSTCDSPNLQNVPKRKEAMSDFRKLFIPRFDLLLDVDYKGAEVVVQAMLANDKVLIEQLREGFDSHRYWASRLFGKAESEVTKKERQRGKNEFVFPILYGAHPESISKAMGLPLEYVKECWHEFFGLYKGIAKYQRSKLKEYKDTGYVSTPLGFRRHAPLRSNQIINYPIQATAFHCLLDSLIQIVKILKGEKFESLPVLQVHDSITFDVVEDELDDLIDIVEECTTNKSHWKWAKGFDLLGVDYETGPNWAEMEELK